MTPHPGVRPILLALLYYFIACPSFAQRPSNSFQAITTEHGLSGNIVYSIYQDKKGYLWIGTNEGLNLYDGYSFREFKHEPGDTNSIPSNRVMKIFEDSTGHLWILTLRELSRYNPGDRNFSNFDLPVPTNYFFCKLDDTLSLIHSDNTIQLFDHVKQIKTPVWEKNKSSSPHIGYNLQFAKDASGRFFLAGIDRGNFMVWKYDVSTNRISLFSQLPLDIKYHSQLLTSFFIDSGGRCWYNMANDIMTARMTNQGLESPNIVWTGEKKMAAFHYFEDPQGVFWISTTEGLLTFDPTLQKINFYSDNTTPFSLSSKNINCVFQDNTGVKWIGTYNGLYKLNPTALLFKHLVHQESTEQGIQSNAVFGLFQQDKNKLRINYLFGDPTFSIQDLPSNQFTHYKLHTSDPAFTLDHIGLKNPMQLDPASIPHLTDQMRNATIRHNLQPGNLYVDEHQNCWFNLQHHLILVNTMQGLNLKTFMFDMLAYDNELFVVTDSGLMILNTSTLQFLPGESDFFFGKEYGAFTCLMIETNGDLWLGSKVGLIYFNRKENTFQQYDADEGLCHESIYSMVRDQKEKIWLGTANGLSCFDPVSKSFTNYFQADGIVNTEYNRHSALALSDGTIYMGGMNGIDIFHPDHLLFERPAPHVSITDFRVHNQSINVSQDALSLQHDDNNIQITFAVMDYQHPSLNKFKYMLEGADREWTISKNPQTSYASLAPGQYQFILYGANSNGTWSKSPARIPFTIRIPWWNSWWFYAVSFLLVAGLLYALYRYRLRHLEKIYSIRNEISRDLHDQVGATLTSISFLSEVAKQQSSEDEMAKETLNKIGDYSREMIGEMNDIVWSINPVNDKFDNIAERMQNYASPLLAAKNMKFEFSSDLQLKNITLTPQQRKNVYLIFKEAVNNAAKYSHGKHIAVVLERKSTALLLTVTDDGKGFIPENGEMGNGLTNMKMRAAAIKGQLSILSSTDSGTKIILEMPITQNAYVV